MIKRKLKYFGWTHFCPLCRSHLRKFLPHGRFNRPNAKCPVCGSLERHRLVWLLLGSHIPLGQRLLHIAPEKSLFHHFQKMPNLTYITGDLERRPNVKLRMDITNIPLATASFDLVYCSHVLEHVPDDRLALCEIKRVLKPTGVAVLLIPIFGEKTIEDPTVTTPEQRLRVFGQEDHVRIYGADFMERLYAAGFTVNTLTVANVEVDSTRFGLDDSLVYVCS